MREKSCQKRNADGRVLKAKIMPMIYIKGSIMKHPCMAMCEMTTAKVIREGA